MAEVKLTVMYPTPTDVEVFEKAYAEEHLPLVAKKMAGHTKFVATRVLAAVGEEQAPFYRIAEFYYPSGAELEEALASEGAQEVAAHVVSISTGGPPVILVGEEEMLPSYLEAARIGSLLFIFVDSPHDPIGSSSSIDTFATRLSAQALRHTSTVA